METWTIEEGAEWVQGVGPLPCWLVVDADGERVEQFRNEEDAEAWLEFNDPFGTGAPSPPTPAPLLWPDATCRCGVALVGAVEPITGECAACFDRPLASEA